MKEVSVRIQMLRKRLEYAISLYIHTRQRSLCMRIAMFCGLLIPFHRLTIILCHAKSFFIQIPQTPACLIYPYVGILPIECGRFLNDMAYQWFMKAEARSCDAQAHLGYMYENGLGVGQNYETALSLSVCCSFLSPVSVTSIFLFYSACTYR